MTHKSPRITAHDGMVRANLALKLLVAAVLLIGLAGAAGQRTARADVITPDQKAVGYCYSIANLKDFPDYLIIESFFRIGGPEVVQDGVCKQEIKNNAGNFYTVKKAGFDPSQLPKEASNRTFFASNPQFLPAKLTISPQYVVDKNSPVTKVEDVIKIINVTPTELQLEFSSVVYTYSDGKTEQLPYRDQQTRPAPTQTGSSIELGGFNLGWTILLPLAALAAIAFIVYRNRRKGAKR